MSEGHRGADVGSVSRSTNHPYGVWEMALGRPRPALAADVIGFSGLTSNLSVFAEQHMPSGEAALLINLGEPHRVALDHAPDVVIGHASVMLMGVFDRPFVSLSRGRKHQILVRLRPAAVRRLLGVSMADHTNRWTDLQDVEGGFARDLVGRVSGHRDWESRFRAVEEVIGRQLSDAARGPDVAAWAWEEMRRAGGTVGIASIAEAAGYSHKQLISRFHADIGVAPKTAARLLRFNRVLRGMRRLKAAPGASHAYDYGYADQAHMITEFRRFAGAPPSAIVRQAVGYTLRA